MKKLTSLIAGLFFLSTSASALAACPYLNQIIPTPKLLGSPHANFLKNLETHQLGEGTHTFLSFEDASRKTIHARFLKEAKSEGRNGIVVLTESGEPLWMDPLLHKSLRSSSESLSFWSEKSWHAKDAFFSGYIKSGDTRYITYTTAKGHVFQFRVTGIVEHEGKNILEVQSLMGEELYISRDRMDFVMVSPHSKKLFLETRMPDGGKKIIEKNVKSLALRKEKLLEGPGDFDIRNAAEVRISNVGDDKSKQFDAYFLPEGLEGTRTGNFASRVQEKFNAQIVYSESANTAKGTNGFSSSSANIHQIEGDDVIPNVKIVNEFELVTQDLGSDTEIHEVGHMKTHDNLEKGIPDPSGIQHRAQSGGELPSFGKEDYYANYSIADESRQHAINFHNATHQRHTAELIQEFKARKKIPIVEAYGVNRKNFLQAMATADGKLQSLRMFNDRHYQLAQNAGSDLLRYMNPKSYDVNRIFLHKSQGLYYLKVNTGVSSVEIPIVGRAYEKILEPVKKVTEVVNDAGKKVRHISFDLDANEKTLSDLRDYSTEYLKAEMRMLDEQNIAILDSRIKLEELRRHPRRQISLEDYLRYQNTFIQVRTSMIYAPEKNAKLQWVLPQDLPPVEPVPALPRRKAPEVFKPIYEKQHPKKTAPEN